MFGFGKKQKEIDRLGLDLCLAERSLVLALELAEGCNTHSSYRAIRKPTANCLQCKKLFMRREQLNHLGLAIRSGRRGKGKKK